MFVYLVCPSISFVGFDALKHGLRVKKCNCCHYVTRACVTVTRSSYTYTYTHAQYLFLFESKVLYLYTPYVVIK